jgi:SPP1 gp7 family putative phage head morphogenesis protein
MSPAQNLLDLAVALKAATGGQIDATTARAMTGWVSAWHELTDEWALALTDLANQADDGRWPSRATVLRSDRALAALAHTAERIEQLAAATGDVVAGDLSALVGMAEDHQLRMIAAQFPDDYPPGVGNLVNPDAMDAIVNRTQTSIVALSAPIPADVEAAIKSILIKGVAMGEHPSVAAREMLQRVGDRFEGGRRRAETIARTSMLTAHRDAALASRIANADVCTGWAWLASLSPRTCQVCISMHGTVFPHDSPGPLDHPNGRCAAVPLTRKRSFLRTPSAKRPRWTASPVRTGWTISAPPPPPTSPLTAGCSSRRAKYP